MILIQVGNSSSTITGLHPSELASLAHELSYIDEGIVKFGRTYRYNGARKYLINKEGKFPTGLLGRVQRWLTTREFVYEVQDTRLRPALGVLDLSQRCEEPVAYIEQQQAVEACLGAVSSRGVVTAPTGVGKTRMIKDLIIKMGVPTLVVPPSANLKHQTYRYLKACLGSKYVGLYSKSTGCTHPITVANIDGLENGKSEHFANISMVLIDEFHHSGCFTYRNINEKLWSSIYYKFGFTATNFRNNPNDQILLESVLSEEIFKMTPVEAIQKGYIVPIQPLMYDIHNDELRDSSNYAVYYKRFVVENLERNRKIIEVANAMVAKGIPTLVLVKQVEHGRTLTECIVGAKFVNGQDEDAAYNMKAVEDFNNLEIKCLVGTSVIGEGVDSKSAGCVILASGEKATSRIMQNVGRVIRKFPNKTVGYVVDFMDHGTKYGNRHSLARIKIYRDMFGVEPIRMES